MFKNIYKAKRSLSNKGRNTSTIMSAEPTYRNRFNMSVQEKNAIVNIIRNDQRKKEKNEKFKYNNRNFQKIRKENIRESEFFNNKAVKRCDGKRYTGTSYLNYEEEKN